MQCFIKEYKYQSIDDCLLNIKLFDKKTELHFSFM